MLSVTENVWSCFVVQNKPYHTCNKKISDSAEESPRSDNPVIGNCTDVNIKDEDRQDRVDRDEQNVADGYKLVSFELGPHRAGTVRYFALNIDYQSKNQSHQDARNQVAGHR